MILTIKIILFACFSLLIVFNILIVLTARGKIFLPMIQNRLLGMLRKHLIIIFINIALLVGGILALGNLIYPAPRIVSPADPAMDVTIISSAQPLKVIFDRPIKKETLQQEINPPLKGQWDVEGNIISTNVATFTPQESPQLDTRYTVVVKDIVGLLNQKQSDYMFSFLSQPAPKIKTIQPPDQATDVGPDQKISVILDAPISDFVQFDFELNPATTFDVTTNVDQYILTPKEPLKVGLSYNLIAYRTLLTQNFQTGEKTPVGPKEQVSSITFKTVDSHQIKSFQPTGSGVLTNTPVSITFKRDMERSSVEKSFSIAPGTEGKITWASDAQLTFTPKVNWQKNTTYKVLLAKGTLATDKTPFYDDFSFNFTTIGYVTVSAFSPLNGSRSITPNSKVSAIFNQAVDHPSAESKFSITPKVEGSFSWDGNKLIFSPGSMSYQTSYTIKIETGVVSINGLDSNQVFTSSFTTNTQTVTLNVPSFRQEHHFDCFSSAAKSALSYKGVSVSEDQITNLVGFDTTPWSGTWRDPNAIWGDPDVGIVGDINGIGGPGWGYGAHWTPVARAISNFRPVEIKTGWNVQGIAQEVAAGNPVMVWWVNGVWPTYELFWHTSGGKLIRAVNGSHVQVVKGFVGSVDNPTSLIVTDSGYGYPGRTMDVGTFNAKWSWFGNAAIIVR